MCVSLSVPDAWASVEVSNSTGQNALHGTNYALMCIVNRIPGMRIIPSLEWVGPDGEVIVSGGNITVGEVEHEGAVSSLTLSFTPVSSSHGGTYTCRAAVSVPWMTTQPTPKSVSVDMPVICKIKLTQLLISYTPSTYSSRNVSAEDVSFNTLLHLGCKSLGYYLLLSMHIVSLSYPLTHYFRLQRLMVWRTPSRVRWRGR